MFLGEVSGVLLLICPMLYALLWHLLLASLGDRTDGKIFWPRKIFLCLYAVFFFSSMHVPQALQNVSNLALRNRMGSSLPLFITVKREKAFNVEKPFSLSL